jgi:hypothetical protein
MTLDTTLEAALTRLAVTGVRLRLAGLIQQALLVEKEADLLLASIKTFQPEQLETAEEHYMSEQEKEQLG